MAVTKLKIKKTLLKRKVEGVVTPGYYGRVISNGKANYEDIVEEACDKTTMHKSEAKMAFEVCIEAAAKLVKKGYIVDLGPLGCLYPSVSSKWVTDADSLSLNDMRPRVTYRAAADLTSSVKGAVLSWTTEEESSTTTNTGTGTTTPTNPSGDDPNGGND